MERKIYFILAIIATIMIPIWLFVILPQILWRIPPDWYKEVTCIGYTNNPDPKTNQWTTEETMVYEHERKIIRRDGSKGVIEDRYIIYDPLTGKVTWEYAPRFNVDLRTGVILDGKGARGSYFSFPLHTAKKPYKLTREYYKELPFNFIREEYVEDLKCYLFEFKGVAEYTDCYAGTENYPGVAPPAGQEIRSSDSLIVRYWVEPVSGRIVKLEEDCPEGDWMVDIKTGKQLTPVLIWGRKTSGDTVSQQVNTARIRKDEIIFKERIIPAGLAALAVIFGITGLVRRRRPRV